MCEKKTRIFRSVSDNSLSFDCEISEKLWSFIKSIMLGSWTVCCDVTGGTKAVLHSEPARCQRTTVRQKKLWNTGRISLSYLNQVTQQYRSHRYFLYLRVIAYRAQNMKFTLLLFCIFAYLLLFFVAGSSSGVANLCEEGKFFDSSKQKYKSCLECKSDMQECYSCCQTKVHGKNMKISSMFVMSS